MAFDPRAVDGRHPSSAPPTGSYFTAQALRAGFYTDPRMRVDPAAPPPPVSAQEEMHRDRQAARNRALLLEEVVRHDHDMSRTMAARRTAPMYPVPLPNQFGTFPSGVRVGERPGLVPQHLDLGFSERLPPPLPRFPEARFIERPPLPLSHRLEAGYAQRPPLPRRPKPVKRERPSVLRPKPVIKKKLPMGRREPREHEGKLPKKLSGTKRKVDTTVAADDLPQPAKKRWSCSLCQVSTTSEQGLKDHIQGKKHKAKEEESLGTKPPTAPTSDGSALLAKEADKDKEAEMQLGKKTTPKQQKPAVQQQQPGKKTTPKQQKPAVQQQQPGKKTTPPKQQKPGVQQQQPGKKTTPKQQKPGVQQQQHFYCEVCKVKCNSQIMLDSHLNGKKHKAQLEESNKVVDVKPVIAVESGKDESALTVEESGKAGKPVTATKRVTRVVKKVKKETTEGDEVVIEETTKEQLDTLVIAEAAAVDTSVIAEAAAMDTSDIAEAAAVDTSDIAEAAGAVDTLVITEAAGAVDTLVSTEAAAEAT